MIVGDLEALDPLAVRVARRALAARAAGTGAGAPGPVALDGVPDPAAVAALTAAFVAEGRADAAREAAADAAVLWQLLGTGAGDPVDGLAGYVALALTRPAGNPLWEDLRRLRTLLGELAATARVQRRRRLLPGGAARLRGTAAVTARAIVAFTATWSTPPGPG